MDTMSHEHMTRSRRVDPYDPKFLDVLRDVISQFERITGKPADAARAIVAEAEKNGGRIVH